MNFYGTWFQILNPTFCSGRLRKRILTEGVKGYNVGEGRPNRGDVVVCNVKGFFQEEEFQTFRGLEFALGEAEVIQALDLVVALMNTAEVRKIFFTERLQTSR